MTTISLDFKALILQGIADAGGQPEDAHLLTEDDVKNLGRLAAERGAQQRSPDALTVPKDGEIFELTLNTDDANPIGMVRDDGYENPDLCKFEGPEVNGTHTKRFKLVRVGNQPHALAVNRALSKHGTPALGQWREAFKKKYPRHDGHGSVGFTGAVWVFPEYGGIRSFPFVVGRGFLWSSGFRGLGNDFDVRWRFAVEVKKRGTWWGYRNFILLAP